MTSFFRSAAAALLLLSFACTAAARVVSGTVTDIGTEQPVAAATVEAIVQDFMGPRRVVGQTTTDASGHYSFDVAATDLRVSAPGYVTVEWRLHPAIATYDFALSRPATITGTIRDGAGEPLAGVYVYGGLAGQASSDAQGRYSINDVEVGDYVVCAQPGDGVHVDRCNDGQFPSHSGYAQLSWISIGSGETRTLDFVLPEGGTISGVATDRLTGLPIANKQVRLWLGDPGEPLNRVDAVTTDAGGRYVFTAISPLPFTAALEVGAPFYFMAHLGAGDCGPGSCGANPSATEFQLDAGETVDGLDAALWPGLVIEGVVKDVGTSAPIADATVVGSSVVGIMGIGDTRAEKTDASGHYLIKHLSPDLFSGGSTLIAGGKPGYFDESFGGAHCSNAGCANAQRNAFARDTVVTANFFLDRGSHIEGRVADGGHPLPDAYVYIYRGDGTLQTTTRTKADGTYATAGLKPGMYYAAAMTPEACRVYPAAACSPFNPTNVQQDGALLNIGIYLSTMSGIDFDLPIIFFTDDFESVDVE